MQIKDIHHTDFLTQLSELLTKISIMYGLKEADTGFVAYFANTLKKYYSGLTFEQIESAFEYNSIGSLDLFLPKKGFSIDNKVVYTIPDMTKIIEAYMRLNKLDGNKQTTAQEKPDDEKDQVRQQILKDISAAFDAYQRKRERVKFYNSARPNLSILIRAGLLPESVLKIKVPMVEISFKKMSKLNADTTIQDMIYDCFDNILMQGKHINAFLKEFQNEYRQKEMPY